LIASGSASMSIFPGLGSHLTYTRRLSSLTLDDLGPTVHVCDASIKWT